MIIWTLIKKLRLPLILLLICCYTMIERSNVYFVIAFCAVMMPIITRTKLWDKNAIILALFGITYFFITAFYYTANAWANEIIYLLGPLCCYICGKYFVSKSLNTTWLLWITLIVCLVVTLPMYIQTIRDIMGGEIISYSRQLGSDEDALAATLYGLVAAINLSGLGFFILNRKNSNLIFSAAFLVLFICSFLTTIHLINRTGIVITAFALVAMITVHGIGSGLKVIIWLSIILLVALFAFGDDWLINSLDAYDYRNNVQGNGLESGGGRYERWIDAIEKLLLYPLGWWKDTYTYNDRVHNLWLDVARIAGIIPFTFIITFFVRWINTQIKLLRQYKQNSLVMLLFGVLLCMILAASVEPVIEAKVFYFCLMLFFMGIESEIYNQRKRFMLHSCV